MLRNSGQLVIFSDNLLENLCYKDASGRDTVVCHAYSAKNPLGIALRIQLPGNLSVAAFSCTFFFQCNNTTLDQYVCRTSPCGIKVMETVTDK